MVSSELRKSITQGYVFLASVLNTAKIEKLVVPDVVQTGSTDVTLDCRFTVPGEHFTLQWWFSGGDRGTLVYEWTPPQPPNISTFLMDSDSTYKVSILPTEDFHGIRFQRVEPQLSGEYTCVVINNGMQTQETKKMIVFSPEEELEMTMKRDVENYHLTEINCFAHGVYPQPELILEHNKEPIAQQIQRVWHLNSLSRYNAECTGHLPVPDCGTLAITCRLHLPQADYTAIKKRIFQFDEECTNKGEKSNAMTIVTMLFNFYILTV